MTADQETEALQPEGRKGAVVAFSGGVDSCFSAYRHVRGEGLRFPRQVDGAVMIHGFDIPLADGEAFRRAADKSRKILASLDLELMTVQSNYKEIVADFPQSHGPAMASCLALFGGGFREGLIGQTFTYGEIRHIAEGVNALTDPMLSSSAFRVIPDGAAFERADKIKLLGRWDEFLQDLRVCCGLGTRAGIAADAKNASATSSHFEPWDLACRNGFEHDVTDEQIEKLEPGIGIRPFIRYGGLAELAAASGSSGSWVRVLEKRLVSVRHTTTEAQVVAEGPEAA